MESSTVNIGVLLCLQIPSEDDEDDSKDEAICPTDDNFILDDDLREILSPLAEGVKFIMISGERSGRHTYRSVEGWMHGCLQHREKSQTNKPENIML